MIKKVSASHSVLNEVKVTASLPPSVPKNNTVKLASNAAGNNWMPDVPGKFYVSQLASTKKLVYLEKVMAGPCFKGSVVVSLNNGRYILVSKPYESFNEASKAYVSGELKSCNITPWVRTVESIRKILK
jgi:septal ring-binding cell division protein DamX